MLSNKWVVVSIFNLVLLLSQAAWSNSITNVINRSESIGSKNHVLGTYKQALAVAQTYGTINKISPKLSASLSHGEEINITFTYYSKGYQGIRIFLHPMTGKRKSINYRTSGSPLYQSDRGKGNAHFTIQTGDVLVDGIRFAIIPEGKKKPVFSRIFPVKYKFSNNPLLVSIPQNNNKPSKKKIIRADGVIEIRNHNGSAQLISPNGSRGTRNANGVEIWNHISAVTLAPPVPVTEANAEWIKGLNFWLERKSEGMLTNIKQLSDDPSSFENYKIFEKKTDKTLYELVNSRQKFLYYLLRDQ